MSSIVYRLPVSKLLKDVYKEAKPQKKSRGDYRRAQELEEARKAGNAPAAVDENGHDINPHIPKYISNAPWYYGTSGPTLKHQRPQTKNEEEINELDRRDVNKSKIVTKYRKGACENCGALTHKKVDCVERPRKVSVRYSGAVNTYDEFVKPKIQSDYDGKHDRWGSYDPAAHKEIVEKYQKIEDAKQNMKTEKLADNTNAKISGDEKDEDKYVDEVNMPGTKVDSKQRITVRNLRIREDTAKYLRNLDLNSAYYDPKSRSMRDNPNPQYNPGESDFVGENFVRFTCDAKRHSVAQVFACDAVKKGFDMHLLAEPTKLELLHHGYEKKKDEYKSTRKDEIFDKYDGEKELNVPPKSLLLAQTEKYVEYSRSGKVIKGQEKHKNRSRYEEDVLINNHTSVWGSYWFDNKWGYKCCRSFIKQSYCVPVTVTGNLTTIPNCKNDESIECVEDVVNSKASVSGERKKSKKSKKEKKHKKDNRRKTLDDALKAEIKHNEKIEKLLVTDERKRKYNSIYEMRPPTELEIDEYLRKRRREHDAMFQFIEK